MESKVRIVLGILLVFSTSWPAVQCASLIRHIRPIRDVEFPSILNASVTDQSVNKSIINVTDLTQAVTQSSRNDTLAPQKVINDSENLTSAEADANKVKPNNDNKNDQITKESELSTSSEKPKMSRGTTKYHTVDKEPKKNETGEKDKKDNPNSKEKLQETTENTINNNDKVIVTEKSEPVVNETITEVNVKDVKQDDNSAKEQSNKGTGRSLNIDIDKYTSPEFHNKNNVYTMPTSPDIEKYLDTDSYGFSDHVTKSAVPKKYSETTSIKFDFNSGLTTPQSDIFDSKYRRVSDGIKQNLDEFDANMKHFTPDHRAKQTDNGNKYELSKLMDNAKKADNETDVSLHASEIKHLEIKLDDKKANKNVEIDKNVDYKSTYMKTRTYGDNPEDSDVSTINNIPDNKEKIKDNEKQAANTINQTVEISPSEKPDSTNVTEMQSTSMTTTFKPFITTPTKKPRVQFSLRNNTIETSAVDSEIKSKNMKHFTDMSSLNPLYVTEKVTKPTFENAINISKRGSTKYVESYNRSSSTPALSREMNYDNKNFSIPPTATAWTLASLKDVPTSSNSPSETHTEQNVEENQLIKVQLLPPVSTAESFTTTASDDELNISTAGYNMDYTNDNDRTIETSTGNVEQSTIDTDSTTINYDTEVRTTTGQGRRVKYSKTTMKLVAYSLYTTENDLDKTTEMISTTTSDDDETTDRIYSSTPMEDTTIFTSTLDYGTTLENAGESTDNSSSQTTDNLLSGTTSISEADTLTTTTDIYSMTSESPSTEFVKVFNTTDSEEKNELSSNIPETTVALESHELETHSLANDTSNSESTDKYNVRTDVMSSTISDSTEDFRNISSKTESENEIITTLKTPANSTTENNNRVESVLPNVTSNSELEVTTQYRSTLLPLIAKTEKPQTPVPSPFEPNEEDPDDNGDDDYSEIPAKKDDKNTTDVNEPEIEIVHIDNGISTMHPTLKPRKYNVTEVPTIKEITTILSITAKDPHAVLSTTDTENTTDATSSTEQLLDGDNDDESNSGMVAAIAISCVGGVCLVILAGLLLIMRKRQKRITYGQRCTPVSLDAYSLDNVSVYNSVRRKGALRASKRSYGNPAFDDPVSITHQMNFQSLAKFVDSSEEISTEFDEIPQVTARANEVPPGCETKNRYANVIPLPETRVFLKASDNDPYSDYINANYVTGPKNTRGYYIACQAPLQNTVDDFWRMIWEQQCRVVLMLTNLYENGIEKCVDYLPPSEVLDCHRLFGDFQITLKKREVKEKYIISSLQLKNMVSNSWREVTHLWYLGWPERGVPSETNSLIAFLIEARSHLKAASNNNSTDDKTSETTNMHISGVSGAEGGPMVVHCSPGTGRTGTVIACDIAIRDFELTRSVDIPKIVYRVRRDRASAVQTKEQYAYIYKVISLYATKLTGGALDSI
ncbi:uncharacterized protein CBL_12239 [Carabus blaptoides fortunei]